MDRDKEPNRKREMEKKITMSLAYKSEYDPMPLSELEQMMVLTAVGDNTGWHHLIFRHKKYRAAPLELRRRCRRKDVSVIRGFSHQ